MKANIVVAVGVAGTEADCQEFLEIMRADFEHRCKEAAIELMDGRIEILSAPPIDEVQ